MRTPEALADVTAELMARHEQETPMTTETRRKALIEQGQRKIAEQIVELAILSAGGEAVELSRLLLVSKLMDESKAILKARMSKEKRLS